jgi:hypothetical protein
MVAIGGPTAAGDDALKMLYDLDELNHRYHIIKKMSPAQAKEYKRRLRKRQSTMMFIPASQKVVFKTVGRGRGKRVVAMRRKINWRGRAGGKYHSYKNHQVKRWFGNNPVMPRDEWKGS